MPIFSGIWPKKKASSSEWALDATPTPEEESEYFKHPSRLLRTGNPRDGLHNYNFWQDILEKKRFAKFAYRASGWWLIFVGLVVVLKGMKVLTLSEAEIIALITTTTATVLGLALIVGQYLFGKAGQKVGEMGAAAPNSSGEEEEEAEDTEARSEEPPTTK